MAFEIEIPMEMLADERVADAVVNLTRALGSAQPGAKRRRDPLLSPEQSWADFMETTTEQTRQFIALVREHESVTISEVATHLKLNDDQPNKALGGLTGAFSRKVNGQGFQVPYKQRKNRAGERVWVWNQEAWDANVAAFQKPNGVT